MRKILIWLVCILSIITVGCSKKQSELTLEESKQTLAELESTICDSDGNLKYAYGEIVSDPRSVTISMNDGNGKIKNKPVEVYEMIFKTNDNREYRILIRIENFKKDGKYKKGDIIDYQLSKEGNRGWYIGENKEVLYLVITE